MREIKFRAWDKKHNIMVTKENVLKTIDTIEDDYMCGFYDKDEWWPAYPILGIFEYFQDCVNDDDLIVEQYTGLRDKRGKDIYENDIILLSNNRKSLVTFERGAFCLSIDNTPIVDFTGMDIDDLDWCEVIGNIHENPELIS